MLRGHIRNSFNDFHLYNLIKQLSLKNQIQIYIHTWDIIQSNVSWRQIQKIEIPISEDMIKKYFKDMSCYIKEIIIDNDSNIILEGNKQGFISMTGCPKIGWKNMWYGKKRLIDIIKQDLIDMNEIIVNLRFDIFSNSHPLNENFILRFIEENKHSSSEKIIFPCNREILGIDNLYLGNLNAMFNLIYHFHYNLDNILARHYVENQEFVVFRENNIMVY
jgi:hypothetical protein